MGQTRSRTQAAAAPTNTQAPPRRGHDSSTAVLLMIMGTVLCALWGLVVTLQVQTNEAFMNGTTQDTSNILQPQWTIWLQLPKLILGDIIPGTAITGNEAPGVLVGQGIEVFFIGLIIGYEIAMHTSSKLGRIFGGVVRVISFIICVFDFYSDANYGNVSPTAHAMFAIFCSFVVAFALTWGLAMIEAGWKRL